jgi:ADP-ribose pyrophosphatase
VSDERPAFRHLGDRLVYKGKIWDLVVADYAAPDGSTFERDIVRSPGAVSVVPLQFDVEGNPCVVLVRQYRPAFDRWMLEIPAGMRDVPGEPPDETAARELIEEAGLRPGQLERLAAFEPSAGMTDAVTEIYLATHLEPVAQDLHGPEEEHLERLELPLAEAVGMIATGEIGDAKTVIGLLLVERRLAAVDFGEVGAGTVGAGSTRPAEGGGAATA